MHDMSESQAKAIATTLEYLINRDGFLAEVKLSEKGWELHITDASSSEPENMVLSNKDEVAEYFINHL
jgi:hypothetical protein